MAIYELLSVARPNLTSEIRVVDWLGVEARLGLRLPEDYKAMISNYGRGTFGDYVHLCDIGGDLERHLRRYANEFGAVEEGRAKYPSNWVDLPLYPTSGGFLPWAHDDNAGPVGWLTTGDPESWPTILIDGEYSGYDLYEMPATEFLTKWLTSEIIVPFYPPDIYPFQEPYFVSNG